MSRSEGLKSQLPTGDELPGVGTKSVFLDVARGDEAAARPELRRLDGEMSLPELGASSDRYRVLDVLGEGGMGKVYLAYDTDLKRRIALKVVTRLKERHVLRFIEEAQVMAQLDHPNIVPVFDAGMADGKPYYTMRVVRGRTLGDVIDGLAAGDAATRAEHSLARRMQVLVQIGQALGYAHEKGVVHRDLKPANVMLGPYGEVQVMDWGLSRVIDHEAIATEADASKTRVGQLMGTPAYMAPEQALGEEVDARADIYALGVILYELLTLGRPFSGDSRSVMDQHVETEPEPPRRRAPEREIPVELQETCLEALRKKREDRFQSVADLIARVQTWLEASADRERRRELADAKAREGENKLEEYHRLAAEVGLREAEEEEAAKNAKPWQSVEEKAELYAARAAVRRTRRALADGMADVVETLEQVLEYQEDHARARELLGDYYWDRFRKAELERDEDEQEFYRKRVARYHDGKYARELEGDGSLELTSDPPGAEVWLSEYLQEGPVLVERNERRIGSTALPQTVLAMGSYLVVLRKEGCRDTRYPVFIERNGKWAGGVRLRTDDEIGAGFCYVPAGPFVKGGDPGTNTPVPRTRETVGDFVIAKHPVTMAEYLVFLNEIVRSEGVEAAFARSPRTKPDDPRTSLLVDEGCGGLALSDAEVGDDEALVLLPDWPVMAVAHWDAEAYCAWYSRRQGREYRLPTEVEWEKAAGGVDGRWYPWGNERDPSLCNMRESQRERMTLVSIHEFPGDVSVYGVRGMGGNVSDWTSSFSHLGEGDASRIQYVHRGGCWPGAGDFCRVTHFTRLDPNMLGGYLGFRLARSLD